MEFLIFGVGVLLIIISALFAIGRDEVSYKNYKKAIMQIEDIKRDILELKQKSMEQFKNQKDEIQFKIKEIPSKSEIKTIDLHLVEIRKDLHTVIKYIKSKTRGANEHKKTKARPSKIPR